MEEAKRRSRRRHDSELKRLVLAQCCEPGASVAQVAMAHGLNANLVHKWRRMAVSTTAPRTSTPPQTFVPVSLAPAPMPAAGVRIDLRRGATTITVNWPASAASECASWLRELLR